MFDILDTAFSYERKLTVCSFLQDFYYTREKEVACNQYAMHILRFYFERQMIPSDEPTSQTDKNTLLTIQIPASAKYL